jgi:YD repeat-containing protein
LYTYSTAGSWPAWTKAAIEIRNDQGQLIGTRWTKTTVDGFGRTIKVEHGQDSTAKSIVDTEYTVCACSALGKVWRVSQPYAQGLPPEQRVWTSYTYDALGRTVSVAHPGSSGTTTYTYSGNTVTITDPAGKWKKYTMNALGNLTQVTEPRPGGGEYTTSYTYDKVKPPDRSLHGA